jgi:hypothetical protein
MEDIINFIQFAVEESTIHHDIEENPSINAERLTEILVEYITKRENKLKKQLVAEAKQAIQKILLQ